MKNTRSQHKYADEVHEFYNDDISCYSMSSGTVEMASVNEPDKKEVLILAKAGKVTQKNYDVKQAVHGNMEKTSLRVEKPLVCDLEMLKKYRNMKKEAEKDYKKVEITTSQPLASSKISEIVEQTFEKMLKESGKGNAMKIDFNLKTAEIDINMVKTDQIRAKYGRLTREALDLELAKPVISEDKLIKLECNKIARDIGVISKPAAVQKSTLMKYVGFDRSSSKNKENTEKNPAKKWYGCSIM